MDGDFNLSTSFLVTDGNDGITGLISGVFLHTERKDRGLTLGTGTRGSRKGYPVAVVRNLHVEADVMRQGDDDRSTILIDIVRVLVHTEHGGERLMDRNLDADAGGLVANGDNGITSFIALVCLHPESNGCGLRFCTGSRFEV